LPKIGLEDIVSSCLTLHTGEMWCATCYAVV
jgi:hypothetical protein